MVIYPEGRLAVRFAIFRQVAQLGAYFKTGG
jgi:hypothetical protein